jgi:hypothetical protein
MSRDEVLSEFETVGTDPGSQKSGEYFYEHLLTRAKRLVVDDREGLVEALSYWLSTHREPDTMAAVRLARDLIIPELETDLKRLKQDIESRRVFLPFYVKYIDQALAAIRKN